MEPTILFLFLFATAWLIAIYFINSLIADEFKKINAPQAVLHFTTMSLIGLVGEIAVGSFYKWATGSQFWTYTVYPIHHGYTSKYAFFLWGIVGFHLYLLHGTLKRKNISSLKHLALFFSLEAIILEASVNITFKLFTGNYLFYYHPSDLWHYTSFQTLPFYLAAGFVIVKTFRQFETNPKFFIPMSFLLASTIAFLI